MDAKARTEFKSAQAAALEASGVEAEDLYIEMPMLKGRGHVLVAGEGPPVVMMNGIGTPAAMWAPLMANLTGHRLYAVDLPGYGLTDAPPTAPADLRSHAADFVGGVLDRLKLDRPAFIGNSLGSLWALWLAMNQPGRVGPMVHVGCPAIAPGTSAPLPMRMLGARGLGRLMMRLQPPSSRQVRQLAKLVNQHPMPPEIAAVILATERMPGFERTFLSNLQALVRPWGPRPEMALTDEQLARVSQPSLLAFGRSDPMGSEPAGRRMEQALPHAELHLAEGGHAPWLNEPERIAGWINPFLGRNLTRNAGVRTTQAHSSV